MKQKKNVQKPKKTSIKRGHKLYKQRETDEVKAIEALGLTEAETRTYLAILEGPGSVASIARAAGLRRSAVYAAIPRLEASALPRGKRRLYVAEPPTRLQALASRNLEGIAALLPALDLIYRRPGGVPTVRMVQGVEAIRALHDHMVDVLGRGEQYCRFSSPTFKGGERTYISRGYKARVDAKRIQRLVITNIEDARRKKPHLDREMHIVPSEEKPFAYNVALIIYRTTVEIIDYNSDLALVIEDKLVAAFCRHIFLVLYDRLPSYEPR